MRQLMACARRRDSEEIAHLFRCFVSVFIADVGGADVSGHLTIQRNIIIMIVSYEH